VEEAIEVVVVIAGDLFDVDAVNTGETAGNFDDVSRARFVCRDKEWAEVRTIGLDQQTIERDFFATARSSSAFLKVTMPENEIMKPSSRALRARSMLPLKQ
jgi:hypothetical protein